MLVECGTYVGWCRYVDSLKGDGWIWVMAIPPKEEHYSSVIIHEDEVKIRPPENTLAFSKEQGFNVTVGDTLQIARGPHYGVIGIVRSLDFPNAEVEVISEENGCPVRLALVMRGL